MRFRAAAFNAISATCSCMLQGLTRCMRPLPCACMQCTQWRVCIVRAAGMLLLPALFSYTHARMHAYMHTCIQAYRHASAACALLALLMHAYMHTCIQAYMHTCIQACFCCLRSSRSSGTSRARSRAPSSLTSTTRGQAPHHQRRQSRPAWRRLRSGGRGSHHACILLRACIQCSRWHVQLHASRAHTMHAFSYVHALSALAETCALCVAQVTCMCTCACIGCTS